MRNQKFKATVFVPKLTDISSIIEIDVDPHDSETHIEYKLIKKLNLNTCTAGILLSKKSIQSIPNLAKLIQFERVCE